MVLQASRSDSGLVKVFSYTWLTADPYPTVLSRQLYPALLSPTPTMSLDCRTSLFSLKLLVFFTSVRILSQKLIKRDSKSANVYFRSPPPPTHVHSHCTTASHTSCLSGADNNNSAGVGGFFFCGRMLARCRLKPSDSCSIYFGDLSFALSASTPWG